MTHLFSHVLANLLTSRKDALKQDSLPHLLPVALAQDIPPHVLVGTDGDDLLQGSDADNVFFGRLGGDVLIGGLGWDQANYAYAGSGLTVNLAWPADNTGAAAGDRFESIEDLFGSRFADRLVGDDHLNHIHGNAGDDILSGLGGDDRLWGQIGEDVLLGDHGADLLFGGEGNDKLFGGAGADQLDGGAGWDQANYGHASAGVTANLAWSADNTGEAAGDRYTSIEDLSGTDFDDRLVGNGLLNHIHGAAGQDIISGLAGDDRIWGQQGDDIILGGRGDDLLFGGADNDVINGGLGNDRLTGGGGADRLIGAQGDDVIIGGAGSDESFGGAGADTFIFNSGDGCCDRIGDFESGQDQILLQNGLTSYAFREEHAEDGSAGVMIELFNAEGSSGSIFLDGLSLTDITAADVVIL